MKRNKYSRRQFIARSFAAGIGLAAIDHMHLPDLYSREKMKFGLVTYQWGRDWDLPTLIANCEKTGYKGVELRTEHAHKVEINLNSSQREEVKKRFADSSVKCIGYGSNFEYHDPDPAKLKDNILKTREYIKLCSDIGATGIKVKPNDLPDGVPREKTIAQIAAALNEVGRFAVDFGQVVRVEAHGNHTQELPNMKAIFEQVTQPNIRLCWNCNDTDLLPPGLEGNFSSVKRWIGDTLHVRELDSPDYPYKELFRLLSGMEYNGWILLEARTEPADRIAAMKLQKILFNNLLKSN